jgi:hypothetical protein
MSANPYESPQAQPKHIRQSPFAVIFWKWVCIAGLVVALASYFVSRLATVVGRLEPESSTLLPPENIALFVGLQTGVLMAFFGGCFWAVYADRAKRRISA